MVSILGVEFAVAVVLIFSILSASGEWRFIKDAAFIPEDISVDKDVSDETESVSAEEGWFAWGPWMTCSRSCDGGISISLRKCRGKCPRGDTIRRQICNMQPCPEPNNFRATQCAAYNDVPYRDRKYTWLPFHDPDDSCALVCQAEGFNFVAKLSPRVQDGTRCREGALDMCVQGKCQPIGCDLRVGSSLKVDECGICGGDGSKCQRPTFFWHDGPFEPCSVTCGGGVQLSEVSCRNKETKERVDHRLCNLSIRPRSKIKHCNRQPCPVVWEPGEWSPCSSSCGAGTQYRSVFCVQGGPNGTRVDIKPEFCPRHKPMTEKTCTVRECPRWFQGPWSPCSATCGTGIQTRAVVCRDTNNQYSDQCDLHDMPRPQKTCSAPLDCPQTEEGPETTTLPPCIPVSQTEDEFAETTTKPASTTTTKQSTTTKLSTTTTTTTQATTTLLIATILPANWTFSARSFFHVGPWEPCNEQGYRKRIVHCQILLEFSRTVVRLPDSECLDIRPVDVESCGVSCIPPSSSSSSSSITIESEDHFYSWNTELFTPCTVSCSGGTETSIIRCLRLPDEEEVSFQHCELSEKPEVFVKSCNDQECPDAVSHSWNVSEYGACSRNCGGGVRTRQVRCFARSREVAKEVDSAKCSGTPPKETDHCNVFDCPPTWKTEPWSKCSSSCSGGFQTRKLHCEKVLAPLAQTVQLPPSKCLRTRPKAIKKCNDKPCPAPPKTTTTTTEATTTTTTTTTQPPPITTSRVESISMSPLGMGNYFEQMHPNRRVTLKAQGHAVLFKGSTAKFHCPLQQPINGSRVLWFKGHRRIPVDTGGGWPRLSASPKGALRLRKMVFQDSGTYTCLAGAFRSDVVLKVKPLPKSDAILDYPQDDRAAEFNSQKHNYEKSKQMYFTTR